MTETSTAPIRSEVWNRDRKIYVGLFLFLSTIICLLAMVLDDTANKAHGYEREVLLQEFAFQVNIPEEALYYDAATLEQVSAVRRDSLERLGIDSVRPYFQLRHPRERLLFDDRGVPIERVPLSDVTSLVPLSLEHSWIRESFRACAILFSEMECGDGIGAFLKENPAVFDERVRPHMLRLLECRHPWPRRGASLVLYSMGDRDEALKAVFEKLLEDGQWLNEDDHDHIRSLLARGWPLTK
ncbi:MAG: hypothetical protein AB7O52_15045 [Planctomycetota bacterium]